MKSRVALIKGIEVIENSIEDVESKFTPHSNYLTQRAWREIAPILPG